MRKSLPCKSCIVLAICRQKYLEKFRRTDKSYIGALKALTKDCPLISDYALSYRENGAVWIKNIELYELADLMFSMELKNEFSSV